MTLDTLDSLHQENERLKQELARASVLVEYDRFRLIMHVRRLEVSVGRLRRFLRRDDHHVKADAIVDAYWERVERGDNKTHHEDVVALVSDAFTRGAAYAADALRISWKSQRLEVTQVELAALRALVKCAGCGKTPACYGRHEGGEIDEFSCPECCALDSTKQCKPIFALSTEQKAAIAALDADGDA